MAFGDSVGDRMLRRLKAAGRRAIRRNASDSCFVQQPQQGSGNVTPTPAPKVSYSRGLMGRCRSNSCINTMKKNDSNPLLFETVAVTPQKTPILSLSVLLKRKSAIRPAAADADPLSEPTSNLNLRSSSDGKAKTGASEKDKANGYRTAIFPIAVMETDEEESEPSDVTVPAVTISKIAGVPATSAFPDVEGFSTVTSSAEAPAAVEQPTKSSSSLLTDSTSSKPTPLSTPTVHRPPLAVTPTAKPASQPVDIIPPATGVNSNRQAGLQNRPFFQRPVLDTIPSAQELEPDVPSLSTSTTTSGSSFSSFILSLVTPRGRPTSSFAGAAGGSADAAGAAAAAAAAGAGSRSAASSVYSFTDSDSDSDLDEVGEVGEDGEGQEQAEVAAEGSDGASASSVGEDGSRSGSWGKLGSAGRTASLGRQKAGVRSGGAGFGAVEMDGGAGFWNRRRWLSFSPRTASAARACARAVAAVPVTDGPDGTTTVKSNPCSSSTSPSKRLLTSPDAASDAGSAASAPGGSGGGSGGVSGAGFGGGSGGVLGMGAGGRIRSGARMGVLSRSMSERLPPLTPLASVVDCDMPLTWTASLDPDLWAVPEHGGGGKAGECRSVDSKRADGFWRQEKDKDRKLSASFPGYIELPPRRGASTVAASMARGGMVSPPATPPPVTPPLVTSPPVTPRLPELTEESFLLSETTRATVFKHLPATCSSRQWVLLYSTIKHGISLLTLYRRAAQLPGPCLLVASDEAGTTFGAFSPTALAPSDRRKYQGGNQSFVFSDVSGAPTVHRATGRNHYYVLPTHEAIAFGGGGRFALRLEEDLLSGSSGECDTFACPCLAEKEHFCMKHVELWGFAHSSRYTPARAAWKEPEMRRSFHS